MDERTHPADEPGLQVTIRRSAAPRRTVTSGISEERRRPGRFGLSQPTRARPRRPKARARRAFRLEDPAPAKGESKMLVAEMDLNSSAVFVPPVPKHGIMAAARHGYHFCALHLTPCPFRQQIAGAFLLRVLTPSCRSQWPVEAPTPTRTRSRSRRPRYAAGPARSQFERRLRSPC